ncbi:MAG: ABC transporter ATP-binding protein [Pseudomonadota bacterium]
MPINFGYAEEKALKSGYDLKMLRWLFPFLTPYRLLLAGSILLVTLITLLDLALPYITKIAIDRYIVPVSEISDGGAIRGAEDRAGETEKTRYYRVDLSLPEKAAIVEKYSQLFQISGAEAHIPYENLAQLSEEDLFALRREAFSGIGWVTLLFLLLVMADFVMNFFQKLVMEYTGQKIMHDLRMHLFNHIQHLSVTFFNKNPVGRLVTRATSDIQNMNELFTSVIAFIFNDLFLLVGIAVVLITINWKLALVTFTVLPFVCWTAFRFSGRARHIFRDLRLKVAEINTRFSETIEGMDVVQLFQQEGHNFNRFNTLNHETYLMGMAQIRLMAVFMPLIELLGVVAMAIALSHGGIAVLDKSISLGALVAFLSYIRMFFRPIREIAEKYNVLQNALASVERISLILDSEDRLPLSGTGAPGDSPSLLPPIREINEIRFDRVTFEYVPDEPVLKEVSFSLSAGETIGIVGPTGAGKTSIINLVIRFHDPTSGRVLINDSDLSRLPAESFLQKIALVPQDPFLFAGTIRENILQGIEGVSDEKMAFILAASNCTRLVDRFPEGLDAVLPSGGGAISSGERQLISIARAFARNPEVIILDEATSHIDSQTEQHIQEALGNLLKNRTAIVVAHRLATVRHLDRILVIHKGRIIETGSHDTLMMQRGFYYRLNTLREK